MRCEDGDGYEVGACLIHHENGSAIFVMVLKVFFSIIFFRVFLSVLCNCGGLFVLLFLSSCAKEMV